MASSMWDTLLGGDSLEPYPVRVGDQCFNKKDASAQVEMHKLGTSTDGCCEQCKDKRDFEGLTTAQFHEVLGEISPKGGGGNLGVNQYGISPVVLDYFHDIASAGGDTRKRVDNLLLYVGMFATVDKAKNDALTNAAAALPAVQAAATAATAAETAKTDEVAAAAADAAAAATVPDAAMSGEHC